MIKGTRKSIRNTSKITKSIGLNIAILLLGIPYAFIILMTLMSRANRIDEMVQITLLSLPGIFLCLFSLISEKIYLFTKSLAVILLILVGCVFLTHFIYFLT